MDSLHSKTSDLVPAQTTPTSEKGGCGGIGCWTLVAIIVIGLYGCYHHRESARAESLKQEMKEFSANSERVRLLADKYGVSMSQTERVKRGAITFGNATPSLPIPVDTRWPSSTSKPAFTMVELNADLKETGDLQRYFEAEAESDTKLMRELDLKNGLAYRTYHYQSHHSDTVEILKDCRSTIMALAANLTNAEPDALRAPVESRRPTPYGSGFGSSTETRPPDPFRERNEKMSKLSETAGAIKAFERAKEQLTPNWHLVSAQEKRLKRAIGLLLANGKRSESLTESLLNARNAAELDTILWAVELQEELSYEGDAIRRPSLQTVPASPATPAKSK